ncbi:MAG TPA: hypothetical protein VMM55_03925 [Thermohalobaculum sp.]|nr:hypothetical protein [Thermohalobaculum sp.]
MTRIMMLMLATAGLGLAGCNTIGGAGEDLSNVGQQVTKSAADVEAEIDEEIE